MLINYKNVEINQQDLCVLNNINMQLDKGEFVYLIGKVGSGKTSLLKTIYGELDIVSGDAEVLGYNIKKETYSGTQKKIRNRISRFPITDRPNGLR